jgi:transmembrane sensor
MSGTRSKRPSFRDLAAMTPAEAASYWLVRHDPADMSTSEKREFDSWLARAASHRSAYAQAHSVFASFEDAADEHELRALRAAALTAGPSPKPWPWLRGLAAAFLGGLIAASAVWYTVSQDTRPRVSSAAPEVRTQFNTAHNSPTTVTLSDGSRVTLNLDTELQSRISNRERSITLVHGQAFFEVAKDPARPFVVTAGEQRIRALGTQFDVRLDAHRVEVVLLEGRVGVDRHPATLLGTVLAPPVHFDLMPNQRLIAGADQPPVITTTDAARATSWRQGWVVFEDKTLGEVVNELNRFSDKPIVTSDEAVRRLHLSGVFRAGEPDRFGAVIQQLLPVTAEQGPSGEIIVSLRSPATTQPH